MNQSVAIVRSIDLPTLVAAGGERVTVRFLEFFASAIRNPHTRRAYARSVTDFLRWCADHEANSLQAVQPLHVATWIEGQTRKCAAPTVKQQLAAIRHLFDWLVVGQVVPLNPAASVRGPAHSVRKGKTPVLDPAEARALLDSIDVTTPIGLRDRALITLMVFSFGRIGAALAMRVEDVFVQNRRLWVRLREKDGKQHEMPCHHYPRRVSARLSGRDGDRGRRQGSAVPDHWARHRPAHSDSAASGQRLCDGATAGSRRRYRNADRQSLLSGDGDHCLPQERRHVRERSGNGEPCEHTNDTAL